MSNPPSTMQNSQSSPSIEASTINRNKGVFTKPNRLDVLLGRGNGANEHPGNRSFRDQVNKLKDEYTFAPTRQQKEEIILDAIKAVTSIGGRFLRKANIDDKSLDLYELADIDSVVEKTRQAIHYCCRRKKQKNRAHDTVPVSKPTISSIPNGDRLTLGAPPPTSSFTDVPNLLPYPLEDPQSYSMRSLFSTHETSHTQGITLQSLAPLTVILQPLTFLPISPTTMRLNVASLDPLNIGPSTSSRLVSEQDTERMSLIAAAGSLSASRGVDTTASLLNLLRKRDHDV